MRRPHGLWQADSGTAKRVRHIVLVSKKGVAAAHRRLEPGECVVRRAHEACVREWCSCAEGMRSRVSSTLEPVAHAPFQRGPAPEPLRGVDVVHEHKLLIAVTVPGTGPVLRCSVLTRAV